MFLMDLVIHHGIKPHTHQPCSIKIDSTQNIWSNYAILALLRQKNFHYFKTWILLFEQPFIYDVDTTTNFEVDVLPPKIEAKKLLADQ